LKKLTPYQRRLFVFLSVATFFEGYDFIALSQLLPELSEEFGLRECLMGLLVAFINVGTIIAYLLVRKADQWGRRRVLTITILGYTVFTVLTGFSVNALMFGIAQLIARVFLIGEWAISMVYAAEEYPAERRGMVIGVIQAFATVGSVVCAATVPFMVATPLGWRLVYFVGVIPLLLLAYARRGLKESARFESSVAARPARRPFTRILNSPYRGRVLQLALIWGLTYICTQTGITFWKEFAVSERGLTDKQVGLAITLGALAAMPMVFYSGKLLDVIGRRRGAIIIFTSGAAGIFFSYTLNGYWPLTVALTFAITGASATLPVLNAYTNELFPTELRGDAFAWSNNLLGRIGYVLSPLIVASVAETTGWGPAVATTALFPIVALVLILVWLPETRGLELEETSAVP